MNQPQEEIELQEIRVKTNQIELQIRDYEHEGAAVIFLHFGGANLMMWQRVVPYFQDRYRLALVDLRGHGKSDRPETGYHIDEMARDVVGVMRQLGLEQAHIVGSSLGAEVGLSLAANNPEKVLSLVCEGALASEFGPYSAWEGTEAEFEAGVAHRLNQIRTAPEAVFPSEDALIENRQQALEEHGLWNEYMEAIERYGVFQLGEGRFVRAWRKYAREDYMRHYFHYRFEDYYQNVKCPILMLPDEGIFANRREKAAMEGLRELAAHARIAAVPGWVHPFGWLLDPAAGSKAVLEFLDSAAA